MRNYSGNFSGNFGSSSAGMDRLCPASVLCQEPVNELGKLLNRLICLANYYIRLVTRRAIFDRIARIDPNKKRRCADQCGDCLAVLSDRRFRFGIYHWPDVGILSSQRARAGSISVPHGIGAADTVNFVPQGGSIAVKQFTFGSVTLSAKKAAAIVALTRELSEHSDADKIIRALLIENVGLSVDKLMLDATDTDGIRPAGLRYGTAALTSAGVTKMLEDLTTLAAAVAPRAGSMEDIVYVASVDLAVKIALALPNLKIPVISTAGFAAGTIAAMVPSALAVEASPEIQFAVSDASALHMDDTPLAISTAGTPNTVAAPVRSLWQTDVKAIRLIFEVDYKWRVAGAIAWMTSIGW
jgi:hypothetical protein